MAREPLPYERRWRYGTAAYCFLVLASMLTGLIPHGRSRALVSPLLLVLFAPVLFSVAGLSICTGDIQNRSGTTRARNPATFWCIIAVEVALALWILVKGLRDL
jgi:hypothetical protein